MKFTNIQIKESVEVISKIIDVALPFKAKLTLSRNKKQFEEVIEVYQQTYQQIIDECVKRDEEGNIQVPVDENGNEISGRVLLQEDKINIFNEKIMALELSEVEVDVKPIVLTPDIEEALSSLSNVDPTPVLWLFEE